jgi:uncharacterized glyoxalase superfamily protein PhnB
VNATRVVPILNVSDIAESFAWFAKLGWTVGFQWPPNAEDKGRITFASLESGECEIFLCRDGQGGRGRGSATPPAVPHGDETSDKGVWLSIWVDDVDAAYRQCHAAGLEITHPPTDEPWGVREMRVRHPDGHVLRISRETVDSH